MKSKNGTDLQLQTMFKNGADVQVQTKKKNGKKSAATMMGLVFTGVGKIEFKEIPKPVIKKPSDALVKILKTTICDCIF